MIDEKGNDAVDAIDAGVDAGRPFLRKDALCRSSSAFMASGLVSVAIAVMVFIISSLERCQTVG